MAGAFSSKTKTGLILKFCTIAVLYETSEKQELQSRQFQMKRGIIENESAFQFAKSF
jgi:hypothetical protein